MKTQVLWSCDSGAFGVGGSSFHQNVVFEWKKKPSEQVAVSGEIFVKIMNLIICQAFFVIPFYQSLTDHGLQEDDRALVYFYYSPSNLMDFFTVLFFVRRNILTWRAIEMMCTEASVNEKSRKISSSSLTKVLMDSTAYWVSLRNQLQTFPFPLHWLRQFKHPNSN